MILYQLRCEDDHTFEAWFRDSGAYDEQAARGHVECPYCGTTIVAKAIMAPHIASGDQGSSDRDDAVSSAPQSTEEIAESAHNVAQKILEAVGQIRDYAEENFEDAQNSRWRS